MSLINEALKKAQKQRTGEAPSLASMPPVGGEPATRIARRAKPASFNTLLLRLGLGAGGLAAVIVAAVLLLRDKPAVETPSAAAPVATAPTPTAVPSAETPAASPTKTETVFVLPIAPPAETPKPATPPPAQPKSETNPVATNSTAPAPASVAEAPKTETAATAPASAAPAAKLEPRAIAYIDNIRVAGIRASATDSKVLMNDRVYRVGDMVEHEMGLKLVGIAPSSLTFEDERGGRYTRNF